MNSEPIFQVTIRDHNEIDGWFTRTLWVPAGKIVGGSLPTVVINGREHGVYRSGSIGGRRLVRSCIAGAGVSIPRSEVDRLLAASLRKDREYWESMA